MKKAQELSYRQMREVTGGDGPEQDIHVETSKHCFIDGEVIIETICTTDAQCQTLYGPYASCR